MNAPFLPADQRTGPLPHGRLSLWDMINFSVSNAHFVIHMLRFEASEAREKDIASGQLPFGVGGGALAQALMPQTPVTPAADPATLARIGGFVGWAKTAFAGFEADAISDRIGRLERLFGPDNYVPWSELHTELNVLVQTIEAELDRHHFFHYKKHKAKRVVDFNETWADIVNAFPHVRRDAFAATDCYGLEHNTASVFYSMRVAERGMRALAKERKVKLAKNKPLEWGTWQDIISKLDDEITRIGKTVRAGAPKERARVLQRCEGRPVRLQGRVSQQRESRSGRIR